MVRVVKPVAAYRTLGVRWENWEFNEDDEMSWEDEKILRDKGTWECET